MTNLELSYTRPQIDIFFNTDAKFNVIPKGRRFGATHGASHACIEWILEGHAILWGDTVNANIDKYVERYFLPALKHNDLPYIWSSQKKTLKIEGAKGFVDFRSADRPENWEGFGYSKIILNEAGIILKNTYLYTNAVLPMLMDYPNAQLFALGVPKGKKARTAEKDTEHPFYTLYKRAKSGQANYRLKVYSSYDNPLLSKEDIKELSDEIRKMNPQMKLQEIDGEFVDGVGHKLWSSEEIESSRRDRPSDFDRVIIAVDPSGGNGKKNDETGIVVVGRLNRKAYILEDRTGKHTPNGWASIVQNLVIKYNAEAVVAEKNYGGEMVGTILKNAGVVVSIKLVTAKRGKILRAEPVQAIWEQGKAFLCGFFPDLENQMQFYDGSGESPNNLDAMVYGVTHQIVKAPRQAFGMS